MIVLSFPLNNKMSCGFVVATLDISYILILAATYTILNLELFDYFEVERKRLHHWGFCVEIYNP